MGFQAYTANSPWMFLPEQDSLSNTPLSVEVQEQAVQLHPQSFRGLRHLKKKNGNFSVRFVYKVCLTLNIKAIKISTHKPLFEKVCHNL
jgi:hypothetical protein